MKKGFERKKLRAIPSSFDAIRLTCYGLILAVFGIAITFGDFLAVMKTIPSVPEELSLFIARWFLFISLAALTLRWIIATDQELDLWRRWLEHPEHTKGRKGSKTAMLALSLMLGIMLALSHNILLITGYFSLAYLLNYWTQWLSNNHFENALRETRKQESKEYKSDKAWHQALGVLEQYWMKRPHLLRIASMMFFGGVAFCIALVSQSAKNPHRSKLELAAYALLTINIFAGEILIGRWRFKREHALDVIITNAPPNSRAHAQET